MAAAGAGGAGALGLGFCHPPNASTVQCQIGNSVTGQVTGRVTCDTLEVLNLRKTLARLEPYLRDRSHSECTELVRHAQMDSRKALESA